MDASLILRSARRGAGLSQARLAERAHVPQSTVAVYERGRRDPGVGSLSRLLAAAGAQLVVLPSTRPTVAAVAREVVLALEDADFSHAWRLVLGANDTLTSAEPLDRLLLAVTPPEPTGDARLDATLAGLVGHHLGQANLPLPRWIDEPSRFLAERWYVDDSAYGQQNDPAETPEALLDRGVVWAVSGLVSI